MQLRLFCVKNGITGKQAVPEFFGDKKKAKNARDQLNSLHNCKHYHVSFGPDHHKFKTHGEK